MYLAKIRSYFDSVGTLSKDERYAVWDAVNTMEQGNMTSLGLHDEPLHGKGKGFRSCRANQDVRLIYVPFGEEGVLCYAGHHEEAYKWAERHKCAQNPTTHMVQVYEDVAKQASIPVATTAAFPPAGDRANPFLDWPSDDDLKTLGVPDDQIAFVRGIKNEDDLANKGGAGVMPDNIWNILASWWIISRRPKRRLRRWGRTQRSRSRLQSTQMRTARSASSRATNSSIACAPVRLTHGASSCTLNS